MNTPFARRAAVLIVVSSLAGFAGAQTTPIGISTVGTYSQNFDGMSAGNTPPPVYPSGWNGFKFAGAGTGDPGMFITANTNPAFVIGEAGNNPTGIYDVGFAGANPVTDRALGSLSSGIQFMGFGAVFQNNTGQTITQNFITIAYRAEQWRTGAAADVETWTFEFRVGDPGLDINDTSTAGWTQVTALDMHELLSNEGPTMAVDGNAPGNFAQIPMAVLNGLVWQPGQVLAIRWRDDNVIGSDSVMAIDDFALTFHLTPVPEPNVPTLLGGVGAAAFLVVARRKRVQA
jgi:hypothetical protein